MTPHTIERVGATDPSVLAGLIFTGAWCVQSTTVHDDCVAYVVARIDDASSRAAALSRCEQAVLVLAFHGHANKHIAATLSLSTSSVSTLLRRARDKLRGRVPPLLLSALCRELPGAPLAGAYATSERLPLSATYAPSAAPTSPAHSSSPKTAAHSMRPAGRLRRSTALR